MISTYRDGKWYDDGVERVEGWRERLSKTVDAALSAFRGWCYSKRIFPSIWRVREPGSCAHVRTMKIGGNYYAGMMRAHEENNRAVDKRHSDEAYEEIGKDAEQIAKEWHARKIEDEK